MRGRFTILGVIAVAIVLTLQLARRERAPPEPARMALPAVDPAPPPPPAEPAAAPAAPQQSAEAVVDGGARRLAEAADALPGAAPDGSRRFVFDCGSGVVFMVRMTAVEATLFSPQALGAEAVALPRVESDAGMRFAADGVSYWSRGGLATFEIRGRFYADCTSSPGAAETAEARRRRATFRASGSGPSWSLEIRPERLELAVGTRQLDFPYRAPTAAGTRTTYRTFSGTQELNVLIDRVPCNDTASGEAFEATVTVLFENQAFYGCGQAL